MYVSASVSDLGFIFIHITNKINTFAYITSSCSSNSSTSRQSYATLPFPLFRRLGKYTEKNETNKIVSVRGVCVSVVNGILISVILLSCWANGICKW